MTKVLFHCHTTFSNDGKLSCEDLVKLGNRYRFNFIFLSDHYEHLDQQKYIQLAKVCRELNEKSNCQLIPGYEKSWEGYHICAYNLPEWIDSQNFDQWCYLVENAGGIVVAVHPAKYDFNFPEKFYQRCEAVEVWNSKWPYDGRYFPNPKVLKITNGKIHLPGQDVHKRTDFNHLAAIVEGRIESATDVLRQIRSGNYSIKGSFHTYSEQNLRRYAGALKLYQPIRSAAYFTAFNLKRNISNLFRSKK